MTFPVPIARMVDIRRADMVSKVENGVVAIIELEVVDIVGIKAVGTVEVSMADCGGTNIAGIRKLMQQIL